MTDPLAAFQDLTPDAEGKVTLTDAEWEQRLSPIAFQILRQGGTEHAGTGPLTDHQAAGNYHCAGCGLHLYTSEYKFHSGCGWPSFDDEVPNAVIRLEDRSMGRLRTEIRCKACDGHLGHVFHGEHMTAKNTRHCVNSASIVFVPQS